MTYSNIKYQTIQNVAIITYSKLHRRNAWCVPMYREIIEALEIANNDDNIGAILITNEGDIFCAGTDFKAPPEPKDEITGIRPNIALVSMAQDDSWLHILANSKPVIGCIQGAAIGLGITQILPFDIRIGSKSSSYSFPFLDLKVMPELGATALLSMLVGYGRAIDIILSSAKLSAEEALNFGLITKVFEDDECFEKSLQFAQKIASYPKLQTKLTRNMMLKNAFENDFNKLLKVEVDSFVEMFKALKREKTI